METSTTRQPVARLAFKMGPLPAGSPEQKRAFVHDYIRRLQQYTLVALAEASAKANARRQRDKDETLGRLRLLKLLEKKEPK
jgi:hypothetical protein